MEGNTTMNGQDYCSLIRDTAKTISSIKKSEEKVDPKQIAELYAIYYNAFAGALRSGVMFQKYMDYDGYPKFKLIIGDESYSARDAAMRDILKDDYERITRFPYKDTSESYVKAYTLVDEFPEVELEALTSVDATDSNNEAKNAEAQAKLKRKVLQAEKKKQEAILREKNRQLLKDARGFDYDPNYDHYYSDRLPEIIQELDSSAMDNAARIITVAVSAVGIILALALL